MPSRRAKRHSPLVQFRAVALDEVLVAVRRVEAAHADDPEGLGSAHDLGLLAVGQLLERLARQGVGGEVERRPLGPVGLARSPAARRGSPAPCVRARTGCAPRRLRAGARSRLPSRRRGIGWLDDDRAARANARSASTRLIGGLLQPVDGGLEPLGFGHLPLVQREPLDRPAVREVGPRLMAVVPDDPTDARGRFAPSQARTTSPSIDPLDEVEDLVRRPADLLGDAGIPFPEQLDQLLLRRGSFS